MSDVKILEDLGRAFKEYSEDIDRQETYKEELIDSIQEAVDSLSVEVARHLSPI
jgi:hypothetical protein